MLYLLVTRFIVVAACQSPQLHFLRMTAFAAGAVYIHTIITDREFFYLLQLSLCEQITVLRFPHLTASGTDHVVMILVTVRSLVFRHVPAKLMFNDKTTI